MGPSSRVKSLGTINPAFPLVARIPSFSEQHNMKKTSYKNRRTANSTDTTNSLELGMPSLHDATEEQLAELLPKLEAETVRVRRLLTCLEMLNTHQ